MSESPVAAACWRVLALGKEGDSWCPKAPRHPWSHSFRGWQGGRQCEYCDISRRDVTASQRTLDALAPALRGLLCGEGGALALLELEHNGGVPRELPLDCLDYGKECATCALLRRAAEELGGGG